ncbi:MAG: UDP-N-acetylmuramoyl-tripeptide--D-alanyl-D-alanine ligase [Fidelibacterota bacterium]|nr:MAG: UDP-N-acetylmuramoyl-tripeptide--D-alanyl-D-alanine ligase [Candidatus Neomarinimicrobiota bacterium]
MMRIELAESKRFTRLLQDRYGLGSIPEIRGITIDSRKARAGDLFVPIVGSRADGHDFASEAMEAGAVAVMVERDISPLAPPAVVIKVADNIRELGALAQVWRQMYQPRVVAITGSNGKTTTKNLVVGILAMKYKVLGTEGSYNSTISLPLTLLRIGQKNEIAVLELGSNRPGEIAYLARLAQPEVGLITNVSEAHVVNLKNKEGVIREKAALFKALPPDGTAVVNVDDPAIARMETPAWRYTYGFDRPADVTGRYEEAAPGGVLVVGTELRIRLPQAGAHLAANALAAVAIAERFEVTPEEIKEAIEGFTPPPGRGEILHFNGVTVIDDSYNANLASTLAGLETLLHLPSEGRRIAVIGDMLELGRFSEEHHRLVGEFAAARGIDLMLCYGPETRGTYCTALSAGMEAHHYGDKSELSYTLAQTVAAGDVVYVKGSRGMAMETVIKEVFNR